MRRLPKTQNTAAWRRQDAALGDVAVLTALRSLFHNARWSRRRDRQRLCIFAFLAISIGGIAPSTTGRAEPGEEAQSPLPKLVANGRCELDNGGSGTAPPAPLTPGASPTEFGRALAEAAMLQTRDLIIYANRYRDLAFPLGDVSPLYGVCTDVVIRAYRALGIDLQPLVKLARVGAGDASIDHRRVEVLRRFFVRYGQILEPSEFADDYLPGDIVTYYRPQNAGSQSHIAIVSTVIGASGRPLVVHNRGWGPQIEDALFVDRMTGHFRYQGGAVANIALAIRRPRLRSARAIAKAQLALKRLVARSPALKPHLKRASEVKAPARPKS